jgi:hypothetical protein
VLAIVKSLTAVGGVALLSAASIARGGNPSALHRTASNQTEPYKDQKE